MKKLFSTILTVLFFVSTSFAATNVSFRWQPNVEPDLSGYKVYRSGSENGTYTEVGNIPCGPSDSSCSEFTEMGVPDGTYWWYATALDTEGFESIPSNKATDILDSTPPEAPQNMNIVGKVLAWIGSESKKLYGWVMKFFRDNPDFEITG